MRFKTLERISFGLFGSTVPAVHVSDIDSDGKIHTIRFMGEIKERPNSIIDVFDASGWEKDPSEGMVTIINEQGLKGVGYAVSASGKTVSLYTDRRTLPNLEKVIGAAATMDDVSENMDLEKSNRKLYIGIALGMPVGYILISLLLSVIGKVMS